VKKHIILFVCGIFALLSVHAQYTTLNAHSHNDYLNDIPFWSAYYNHFGSIEADIWEVNGELLVAHGKSEINPYRTLDSLYIQPIVKIFRENGNKPWKNIDASFQLLIDLKNATEPSLSLLSKKIAKYPQVFDQNVNKNAVRIVITGNCPKPEEFSKYPSNIFFDGKLKQNYSSDQLKRVALFSEDLKVFTSWNGKANIPASEQTRLIHVIDSIHYLGSKIRFWGAPDNINSWKAFIRLGVDFINTDHIDNLANYLNKRDKSEYTNEEQYQVYQPGYKNMDSLTKVKNVILLIGDGMGLAQLYAGCTANHGKLTIFNIRNVGFSKTNSSDSYDTDSGAGGTALATGIKTRNRHISVDTSDRPIPNIPEIISRYHMKSGVISSGDITDATPAVFYAHQPDRSWSEKIAADFLNSPVQILMGGNQSAFNHRKDGRDLLKELKSKNFQVELDFAKIDDIKHDKVVVLDEVATKSMMNGRKDFLLKSTRKAIELLKSSPDGFFLMVEGAQIDYGGHQNNMQYVVREMLDFDTVVAEAMKFADQNRETLVIVTADHETGGLTLLDGNYRKGSIDGQFSSDDHTGIMVPVFAYGPGSLDFRGVYENTEIFTKIIDIITKNQ